MYFYCPHCKFKLSAPEDCAGRSARCRSCNRPVIVPDGPRMAELRAIGVWLRVIAIALLVLAFYWLVWVPQQQEATRDDIRERLRNSRGGYPY